jgi:ABC-type multidrug transport system fused ATPase/permease subunit
MFKNIIIIFRAFYKNVKRTYIAHLIFTVCLAVLTPIQLICLESVIKNLYDRSLFIFSLITFILIQLFIAILSHVNKLCLNSFELDGQHALSEVILKKVSLIDYASFDNVEGNAKLNIVRDSPDKFVTKYFSTIASFIRCMIELAVMIFYFLQTLNAIIILMVAFVVVDTIVYYRSIRSMNEMFDLQSKKEVIVTQIEKCIDRPNILQYFNISGALDFIDSKLNGYIGEVLKERLKRTYHSQHSAIFGRVL